LVCPRALQRNFANPAFAISNRVSALSTTIPCCSWSSPELLHGQ
jgi:alpha-galactosidase/6-phospho-beta-glucosidase family protein